MSPKGLEPCPWHYWAVVESLKVGTNERSSGHWGVHLKVTVGPQPPLFCSPSMMYCLTTGPKAMEPTDHGLGSPKLWKKPFLFISWFISDNCNAKLTSTSLNEGSIKMFQKMSFQNDYLVKEIHIVQIKTGEVWVRKVKCIDINILAIILCYGL